MRGLRVDWIENQDDQTFSIHARSLVATAEKLSTVS